MYKALLGIDLGTSSVKVRAVGEDGTTLAQASRSYPTTHPHDGWAEQDPNHWWNRTLEATSETISQVKTKGAEIVGIGLSGQMHSFVLIDPKGNPVRPGIIWMDTRARSMVSSVKNTIEQFDLMPQMLNEPAAGLSLLPLLWIKNNQPHLLDPSQGLQLLFVKDYIKFKLTGTISAEITDASASLLFDIPNRCWSSQIMAAFDLPMEILPPVFESNSSGGTVLPDIASTLGISANTPVAHGAGDQQSAALATGVLHPGEVQLMLGTGAQVLTPIQHFDESHAGFLNIFCHLKHGLAQGSVQNAGSALNWAREMLNSTWDEVSNSAINRFPKAPYFLPYLTGERAPIMNSLAMGSWLDLRLSTTKEQVLYSTIEGVSFSIVQSIQGILETAKRESTTLEIRCSGGGSSQLPFVQLISDTLGLPLTILDHHGGSVTGAVVLAAMVAGLTKTYEQGYKTFGLSQVCVVEPNFQKAEQLQTRLNRFRDLQQAYLNTIE